MHIIPCPSLALQAYCISFHALRLRFRLVASESIHNSVFGAALQTTSVGRTAGLPPGLGLETSQRPGTRLTSLKRKRRAFVTAYSEMPFACASGLWHSASPASFAYSTETWRWRISLSLHADSLVRFGPPNRVLQGSDRQRRAMQLIRWHAVQHGDQVVNGQLPALGDRPADD